jgi:hypothetical protein
MFILFLSFCGWLLCAVAFEYAFEVVTRRYDLRWPKGEPCTLFWLALGVVATAAGGVYWWCHVLAMLPVAASHIDLAQRNVERVRLKQLVENVVPAIRRFAARLSDVYR